MPAPYRATEREPSPDSPATLNELCYTVHGSQVRIEAWLDRTGLDGLASALPAIAARLKPSRKLRSSAPSAVRRTREPAT